jgi:hypothetical protein
VSALKMLLYILFISNLLCIKSYASNRDGSTCVKTAATLIANLIPAINGENETVTLLQQAKIPFTKKFEKILQGQSLKGLSDENLKKIVESLPESSAIVTSPTIEINHSTDPTSAHTILNSGEFLSLDERVRRKIIPADKKLPAASNPRTDGIIGEQDTVYLAIREKKGVGQSYSFGFVSFQFQPEVLDQGYFTFNAFTAGSSLDKSLSEMFIAKRIPEYRKQIFTGEETFNKLMSAMHQRTQMVHTALVKQKFPIRKYIADIENSLKEQRNLFENETVRTQVQNDYAAKEDEKFGVKLLKPFFDSIHVQIPPEAYLTKRNYGSYHVWNGWRRADTLDYLKYFERIVDNRVPNESDLLRTFQILSTSNEGYPIFSGKPGFWELKVPNSLTTEKIKSIRIQTKNRYKYLPTINVVDDNELAQFRLEAKALANRNKTNVTETRDGDVVEFSFK